MLLCLKKIEKRPVIEVNTAALDSGDQLAIVFDRNKAMIAKRKKVQQSTTSTKILTALSGFLLTVANRKIKESAS